jgi:DNA-binding NtrC family response regulator
LALDEIFDVGLIDFNLGGDIDGLALIERLAAHQPLMRAALITAAWPEQYAARAAEQNIPVFAKPLSIDSLDGWLAGGRGGN